MLVPTVSKPFQRADFPRLPYSQIDNNRGVLAVSNDDGWELRDAAQGC